MKVIKHFACSTGIFVPGEGLQLWEGFLDNALLKDLGVRLGWVVVNRDRGVEHRTGYTPGTKCSFDDLLGAMATV